MNVKIPKATIPGQDQEIKRGKFFIRLLYYGQFMLDISLQLP